MKKRLFALSAVAAVMLSACGEKVAESPAPVAEDASPQVTVKNGTLQGVKDDDIRVFKGIPYAKPPVGENRWRSPQPVADWNGVKEVLDYGNDCMQKPFPSDAAPLGKEPAEDCLYVNVWAPQEDDIKRPVVVWIHGGGYVNGGASPATYDGSEFARAGVIFVSFNYRLGRFGFFAHPALSAAEEGPLGNYAFEDQIAAMQWVKDNVEAFGGDKNNVTIMGESAGGGSVHNLMQTPGARGTFQRAIIMSGGGRSLVGERSLTEEVNGQPSAEQIGVNFAEKNGISGNGAEALAALRALPAAKVVDGLNLMALFQPPGGVPTYVGGPIADGDIVQGSTQSLLEQGKVAKVPVMVGTTSQDIGFSMFPDKESLFASFGEYAQAAKDAYDLEGTGELQDIGAEVAQDRMMQEPARFVAERMTDLDENVYMYRYGYVAESVRNGKGAPHASEIPFFFKTADVKYPDATEQDLNASELVFDYVVSFIENGDPNVARLPEWKPYDNEAHNIMTFTMDATAVHGEDPWTERLDVVQRSTEAAQAAMR